MTFLGRASKRDINHVRVKLEMKPQVPVPTPRQVVIGLERFNEWERHERRRALPQLGVSEGLRQFLELSDQFRAFRPDPSQQQIFIKQAQSLWSAVRRRYPQPA
jgi:hypothetical protein